MGWSNPNVRDLVIRTLIGEGAQGDANSWASVANVLKNRAITGGYGDPSVNGLTNAINSRNADGQYQFSMWSPSKASIGKTISPNDPIYQRAGAIADGVFNGNIPDNTGGADHYYAPGAMPVPGSTPPWAVGKTPTATIGGQQFYKLGVGPGDGATQAPQQTPSPAAAPITPIPAFTGGDYGRQATANAAPFKGIVLHVTGKPDLQSELAYSSTPDAGRGNAYFGYHYIVDRDGKVYQTAPENVRTNNIDPSPSTGLNNSNTLGIAFVGGAPAGKAPLPPTPEQQTAGNALINQLKTKYNIAPNMIVSHGELDPATRGENSNLNSDGGSEAKDEITGYRSSLTTTAPAAPAAAPASNAGFVYGGTSPQDPGVDTRHLEPVFKARIDQLQADAAAAGIKTHIVSAYRDNANQAGAYARLGAQGLAAPPGSSMHQFGRAVDLVADNPAQQAALTAIADQPGRGITSGAHFATPDYDHYQAVEGKTAPLAGPGQTPTTVGADANRPLGTASPGAPAAVSTIVPNPANVPSADAQTVSATAPGGAGFVGPGSDKYSVIKEMATGTSHNPELITAANWGNLFGGRAAPVATTPAAPAAAAPAAAPPATTLPIAPPGSPLTPIAPDLSKNAPIGATGPTMPFLPNPFDNPAFPSSSAANPAPPAAAPGPITLPSLSVNWGAANPVNPDTLPNTGGVPGGGVTGRAPMTTGAPSMGFPATTNPFGAPPPQQISMNLPGSMLSSAQSLLKLLFPPSNVG